MKVRIPIKLSIFLQKTLINRKDKRYSYKERNALQKIFNVR